MSITSISPAASGAPQMHGGPPPGIRQAMGSVAEKLGMSSDELESALKGGSSITDLAAKKGVSRDDAVAALAAGLKANAPQGMAVSDDRATAMAQRMVDGPPAGMQPPGEGGMPAAGSASRLAEAFGGQQGGQDILARLMAGEDVGSVASGSGMGSADLLKILSSRLRVDDRA